jgi:hypothetical protein
MEYGLTWSRKATPSGLRIWRLRASARRTSGNGCSGWPTPRVGDTTGGRTPEQIQAANAKSPKHKSDSLDRSNLNETCQLAGWPTPMAGSPETETYNAAGNTDSSRKTVELVAGWATPAARDWKSGDASEATLNKNARPLNEQAVNLAGWATPHCPREHDSDTGSRSSYMETLGQMPPSSRAGTAKAGVLNPDFTRWLMGYPAAWGCCGATAMQSVRKRGRRSSGRSSTRKAG